MRVGVSRVCCTNVLLEGKRVFAVDLSRRGSSVLSAAHRELLHEIDEMTDSLAASIKEVWKVAHVSVRLPLSVVISPG
jgi:predicted RNA methylase